MRIAFENKKLEALYTRSEGSQKYPPEVVKSFLKKVAYIRRAQTERDLYAFRSLCYEKLNGKRDHQRSVRLNIQWRLVLERKTDEKGIYLLLLEIVDYHGKGA